MFFNKNKSGTPEGDPAVKQAAAPEGAPAADPSDNGAADQEAPAADDKAAAPAASGTETAAASPAENGTENPAASPAAGTAENAEHPSASPAAAGAGTSAPATDAKPEAPAAAAAAQQHPQSAPEPSQGGTPQGGAKQGGVQQGGRLHRPSAHPSTPMGNAIRVMSVEKSFGARSVLNGASIHVNNGDFYALIGDTGSGKTTLLRIILGLETADGGSISLRSVRTEKENRKQRANIGFLLEPRFFPYLDAKANLNYYRRLKGSRGGKKEIERVLDLVGLNGNKTLYRSYSAGMRQRLALANALMGSPDILILDEPERGLDREQIDRMYDSLTRLNRGGTTILITSDHFDKLAEAATTFGFLGNGRIRSELTADQLKNEKKSVQLTIGGEHLDRAKRSLEANKVPVEREDVLSATLLDHYIEATGGGRK
ncbi:MAG: ABC transporter ATP-binding protein [Anaerovoracaceae bacterium]|jgi:ABC-2 type transport system ATP-binding protein